MVFLLEVKDLIYILAVFMGFVTGTVLVIFGIRKRKSNVLIGFSYLSISYAVFLAFLISSGYHVLFPSLYRTGNIGALIFAPLAFIYIRQVLENRALKAWDLLHFIPSLVYFVDFFPIYFFTSLAEKAELIRSEIENPSVFVYFNQSRFFPPNFYTIARTLLIFIYWGASAQVIFRFGRSIHVSENKFGKEWILWMKFYLGSNLLLFVPFFIFSRYVDSKIGYDLIHFTGAIVIFLNSLIVLFFPKVLYSMDEVDLILAKTENSFPAAKEDSSPLNEEKIGEIENKLQMAIGNDKVYLKNGLTISDLSKHADIPTYLLTIYLNQILGTTFSEYINQKRVEECCRLIEDGNFKHLTLEGLGNSCGFNNRNSFITSFKKYVGTTPSEFVKSKTNPMN
ncbi:helix-turn-helix domain-containing protein [Algoriphagus litoralis]|uniref:helix-turn-helix domain-containing protein n=1 Tax=Algoriphagus litoralis TaxID=2202829 RepID=UPI000DBA61DE|nr:helix-turn-helix transcriptional regulator [Algoriphagus litoralis]